MNNLSSAGRPFESITLFEVFADFVASSLWMMMRMVMTTMSAKTKGMTQQLAVEPLPANAQRAGGGTRERASKQAGRNVRLENASAAVVGLVHRLRSKGAYRFSITVLACMPACLVAASLLSVRRVSHSTHTVRIRRSSSNERDGF